SNRLSAGPFMERFENQFATRHDCKHCIMLNSGTSALQVSLAVLKELGGWQDGDEVLVPASTFIATSNVVLHNNFVPVFVDIDPRTYNMDPSDIERHITERTRAIIPVHMYGQPCDMDQIVAISKQYALKVIEDSCECMFARFKGRSVGALGDMGCFSTYVAHILVTGVGGLITTNDDEYAVACRSAMAHGRDSIYLRIDDDDFQDQPERLRAVVARRFNFVRLGHSYRITELEAALGLGQLARADQIIAGRRRNAALITKRLEHHSEWLQLPMVAPDRDHSFMMYPIVCKNGVDRDQLVNYLEECGVETRPMMPLLGQPIYKKLFGEDLEDRYRVAKWVTSNGFYLPCHHGLNGGDVKHIGRTMDSFFSHARVNLAV
ncbi:MAG: DegT/DnrJ/EryC1/StrS family aminotransferase, partial [Acidobacteriota bacterium]